MPGKRKNKGEDSCLKLKLIPWDESSKNEVCQSGHIARLDLTLKRKKFWSHVVQHLVKKWKGIVDIPQRLQIFSIDEYGKPALDFITSFSTFTVGSSLCTHPALLGSCPEDSLPTVELFYHIKMAVYPASQKNSQSSSFAQPYQNLSLSHGFNAYQINPSLVSLQAAHMRGNESSNAPKFLCQSQNGSPFFPPHQLQLPSLSPEGLVHYPDVGSANSLGKRNFNCIENTDKPQRLRNQQSQDICKAHHSDSVIMGQDTMQFYEGVLSTNDGSTPSINPSSLCEDQSLVIGADTMAIFEEMQDSTCPKATTTKNGRDDEELFSRGRDTTSKLMTDIVNIPNDVDREQPIAALQKNGISCEVKHKRCCLPINPSRSECKNIPVSDVVDIHNQNHATEPLYVHDASPRQGQSLMIAVDTMEVFERFEDSIHPPSVVTKSKDKDDDDSPLRRGGSTIMVDAERPSSSFHKNSVSPPTSGEENSSMIDRLNHKCEEKPMSGDNVIVDGICEKSALSSCQIDTSMPENDITPEPSYVHYSSSKHEGQSLMIGVDTMAVFEGLQDSTRPPSPSTRMDEKDAEPKNAFPSNTGSSTPSLQGSVGDVARGNDANNMATIPTVGGERDAKNFNQKIGCEPNANDCTSCHQNYRATGFNKGCGGSNEADKGNYCVGNGSLESSSSSDREGSPYFSHISTLASRKSPACAIENDTSDPYSTGTENVDTTAYSGQSSTDGAREINILSKKDKAKSVVKSSSICADTIGDSEAKEKNKDEGILMSTHEEGKDQGFTKETRGDHAKYKTSNRNSIFQHKNSKPHLKRINPTFVRKL